MRRILLIVLAAVLLSLPIAVAPSLSESASALPYPNCSDPDGYQGDLYELEPNVWLECEKGTWYMLPKAPRGPADYRTIKRTDDPGLCLGVRASSQANGAAIVQVGCDAADHAQWFAMYGNVNGYSLLTNYHSGKCVGVSGGSQAAGALLVLGSCGVSDHSFLWAKANVGGSWELKNYHSGLVLSAPGGSTSGGVQMEQWTDHGYPYQKWTFGAIFEP